jgi:hypothetical protein
MAPRSTSQSEEGQKTKYELQRRDEIDSSLTSDAMDMFMEAWKWDYREVVKRVINPELHPDHPGGAQAFEFRKRCIERGVPEQALLLLDYDRITLNTGIGRGSSAERRSVLSNLNETIYGRLDPEGQQTLTRDTIAAQTDYRYALSLVPRMAGQRPPIDKQIANNENQLLQVGGNAIIVPNQNHEVHVSTHLELLQALNAALSNVEMELEEAIPVMQKASEHCGMHMEYLDPESAPYREFKQQLQQLGEVITNGAKHLEAERRKAEKEQAKMQGMPATEDGTPPGVFGQAVDAAAKMELLTQQGLTKMELQKREADQKLLINDAFAAQKLKHMEAQQQVKARAPQKTPPQA